MKLLEGQWRECDRGVVQHMGPTPQPRPQDIDVLMILTLYYIGRFFALLLYIVLHGAVMP